MTKFRDFDAARAEAQGERLAFVIGGEEFSTAAEVPAGALLDVANAASSGNDLDAFAAFQGLFRSIIAEEDAERFATALHKVGLSTLLELLAWIMEESTGRPLPSASPSPLAWSRDGASSNHASEIGTRSP